mmetsp:Transcript_2931/g.8978  ORF Transcript_2931/g.8978 Transcript_2931/m.8978 type:complete len:244 (+) Transcript_2931:230-961(+)
MARTAYEAMVPPSHWENIASYAAGQAALQAAQAGQDQAAQALVAAQARAVILARFHAAAEEAQSWSSSSSGDDFDAMTSAEVIGVAEVRPELWFPLPGSSTNVAVIACLPHLPEEVNSSGLRLSRPISLDKRFPEAEAVLGVCLCGNAAVNRWGTMEVSVSSTSAESTPIDLHVRVRVPCAGGGCMELASMPIGKNKPARIAGLRWPRAFQHAAPDERLPCGWIELVHEDKVLDYRPVMVSFF